MLTRSVNRQRNYVNGWSTAQEREADNVGGVLQWHVRKHCAVFWNIQIIRIVSLCEARKIEEFENEAYRRNLDQRATSNIPEVSRLKI